MINQFDEDQDLEQEEDKMKLAIDSRARGVDREVRKRLNVILEKNEEQLLLEDKKFLKARASYLTKGQREEYADIINADYSEQEGEPSVPQAPAEPKLEDMKRPELNKMALDLGIGDPESLPNKDAVIAEIRKYQ